MVDPWREAAPAWRPRWCLLWRSAPMTRTESTGPYSMVSGSGSAPTGPQPRGRPRPDHRHRLRAAWPSGRARGRDSGRILVTVVSTSRLPVVSEMSRARWPSSPTSRSCGCLHRGSNAQAVSKTGEAARSLARTCRWPAQVASLLAAGAESTESGRRGSGHRAHATSCACACSARAPAACAPALRAQRQGRPKAAPHAWRPAGLGDTPMVGWYPWALLGLCRGW